mgnify:CR=1 FL=1|tara:strand:- start:1550 stop:1987 length:438 start_codon:yes stop_codon:yes gene_type:complete
MKSSVTLVPAAPSNEALEHFQAIMSFETDCWDTHESLMAGNPDFVLLDVRSPAMYAASHIPGAINLPHGKIINRKMSTWDEDTLFVVYCAGPHCNGAAKAAIRLADLNRQVKLLAGGMTGWADEGFAFAIGTEPSSVLEAEATAA